MSHSYFGPHLFQINTIPSFPSQNLRGTFQIERTAGTKTWRYGNRARSENNKSHVAGIQGVWGMSHRGCQIIGRRHVSHLLPSEKQDNSKSLYLAFKPFHHLVPIFPDSLPTSHVPGIPDTWNYLPMLEFMKIFALVSLCLLFHFPTSLSDKCVLRALGRPQDYPCPLPPQLPVTPSVRDLRLHSGSYLSASTLRSQASKGSGLSCM